MKYELTIYYGGTAVLTDEDGNPVWSSDNDDDFRDTFDDTVTFEEGDDVVAWLEDKDYLPDDCEVDIVEADSSGLHKTLDADDVDGPGDEEDEEDEELDS